MITIRNAKKEDINKAENIYNHIHDTEESGTVTIGWIRNIYPIRKTAEDSFERGDLFVLEDEGKVVATAIINQIQVPDYKYAKWKHITDESNVMVLHTLVVDPLEKGKGYGKAFVSFYEEYAKQHHCSELRMDTNALNINARKMYQKLGYNEIDVIPCVFNGISGVQLVCLEKHFAS